MCVAYWCCTMRGSDGLSYFAENQILKTENQLEVLYFNDGLYKFGNISVTEKTLYLAGDTIWCEEVKEALDTYSPQIIIVNACGAMLQNGEKIIMDAQDVKKISSYAPSSTIIASHMDTVSHLTVTRQDIKDMKLNNVLVPNDNEILNF